MFLSLCVLDPLAFATDCHLGDECVVFIVLPHLSSRLPSLENDWTGQGSTEVADVCPGL